MSNFNSGPPFSQWNEKGQKKRKQGEQGRKKEGEFQNFNCKERRKKGISNFQHQRKKEKGRISKFQHQGKKEKRKKKKNPTSDYHFHSPMENGNEIYIANKRG